MCDKHMSVYNVAVEMLVITLVFICTNILQNKAILIYISTLTSNFLYKLYYNGFIFSPIEYTYMVNVCV